MNRIGRAIAGLVGLSIAAVSVVAATSSPAAGKSAETATPGYVQGYWPGEDIRLCIVDHTEGAYPVDEAVAEFEPISGITIHVTPDACGDGEAVIQIMEVSGLGPCDVGPNGCWVRGGDSFQDPNGLWVHSYGGYIALNSERDLSMDRWQVVIVHEIGHALGLAHTNRRDSVMRRGPNGAADNGAGGLTATDVAVLNDLYSH